MEAYRIWAALNIKGDAIEKMKIFQESIRAANYNLSLLNVNLDKFAKYLAIASPAFSTLAKSFSAINKEAISSSSVFSRYDSALMKTSLNTEKLSQKTAILTEQLRVAKIASEIGFGGLGAGAAALAAASIQGGKASKTLIKGAGYKVGASGYMGEGASIQGGKTSKTLIKAAGHKVGAPGYMMGVGYLGGMAGLGTLVGGYAGYSALSAGFSADIERQQSLMQLKAQGFSPENIKIASDFSSQTVKGISRNELLKAFVDSVMITKELPGTGYHDSKELALLLAKSQFAAGATFGKMSDKQTIDMARAAEIWGASDHKKVMEGQNLMFQMMSSSAGTIEPSQMQQFLAQGSGAFGKLTPMGFLGLEPVLQEIKGRRAATGLITLAMQLQTGAGTLSNKKRVADLLNLGIYSAASVDKDGRPTSTHAKKEFTDLLSTDPFLFQEKVIDLYKSKGTVDDLDIQRRLALDFGRTPSQELFLMHKNRDKILRQREMTSGFWGIDTTYGKSLDTDKGASQRFHNASHNLATAFGELTAPATVNGMNIISLFIEKLASLINLFNTKGFSNQMGNIGMISKSQPIIGAYSSFIHDPFKLNGHSEYGNYSKNVLTNPNEKTGKEKMSGDVYLDKKKVGSIFYSSLADKLFWGNGSIGGTSGFNGIQSTAPSALTNMGNP